MVGLEDKADRLVSKEGGLSGRHARKGLTVYPDFSTRRFVQCPDEVEQGAFP